MDEGDLTRLATGLGFPEGLWSDRDGLRATFRDGELVDLRWVEGGVPSESGLSLSPRARTGERVTSKEEERYARGAWERFNAWSDNERPSPMSWQAWEKRSVQVLLNQAACLFCGEGVVDEPAGAFTSDNDGHLCKPCFQAVGSEEPSPRTHVFGDRRCVLCGVDHRDDDLLYEGPRGKLCAPCVASLVPRQA